MKRKFAINLETNPRALKNRTSVSFQTFLKGLKTLDYIKDQFYLICSNPELRPKLLCYNDAMY